MSTTYGAGSYSGDLVNFSLLVSSANHISRFYCENNSSEPASGTLVRTATGEIVAQATFPAGMTTFVDVDGNLALTLDSEGEPEWPFSINTSWPS